MSDHPPKPDPAESRTPVPDSGEVAPPAFGRYRLTQRLGGGGYGEVWRAEDLFLGEQVALKFLNETFVGQVAALDDLKREVRTLRRLSHPNIVRVHDLVFDSQHTGIVMEFIDGRNLADLLATKSCLEPEDIEQWLPQLASVFDYLHRSEAIIHSDIKPVNLMLTNTGRLKVADFGLAMTLVGSTPHASKTGARPGTVAYMSPQQLRGTRPAVADDIYSLGATFFHLLTGSTPYHGNSFDLITPEKRAPTVGVRRLESGKRGLRPVPEHWESAIAACLAKDPRLRPSSVREFVRWLQPSGSGDPEPSLDTSVILPPASAKSPPKPEKGWQPLKTASESPTLAANTSPQATSPQPAAPVAQDHIGLWLVLLSVGLLALAALVVIALRYL